MIFHLKFFISDFTKFHQLEHFIHNEKIIMQSNISFSREKDTEKTWTQSDFDFDGCSFNFYTILSLSSYLL